MTGTVLILLLKIPFNSNRRLLIFKISDQNCPDRIPRLNYNDASNNLCHCLRPLLDSFGRTNIFEPRNIYGTVLNLLLR